MLYRLVEKELPSTVIVSIGHRSTLQGLHGRTVQFTPANDRFTLRDRESEAAQ